MKLRSFTARTAKEILRDPLTLIFGLGFPLVLLFSALRNQASIPVALFEIDRLTPGLTVFGLSFLTLFSATLIARDRESALLQRLYTTPLTAPDFILGYTLPILPIALAQCAVCYLAALPAGADPAHRDALRPAVHPADLPRLYRARAALRQRFSASGRSAASAARC